MHTGRISAELRVIGMMRIGEDRAAAIEIAATKT
jgi:hypothetical protein